MKSLQNHFEMHSRLHENKKWNGNWVECRENLWMLIRQHFFVFASHDTFFLIAKSIKIRWWNIRKVLSATARSFISHLMAHEYGKPWQIVNFSSHRKRRREKRWNFYLNFLRTFKSIVKQKITFLRKTRKKKRQKWLVLLMNFNESWRKENLQFLIFFLIDKKNQKKIMAEREIFYG